MKREIIHINEELCNGCGFCIPACPEGALQIIDGKARLVSELMCDGLGACLGECPEGAITIEEREAESYSEKVVIREIIQHGENTVVAHLKHLLDHNEMVYFEEAAEYLDRVSEKLPFDLEKVLDKVYEADLNKNSCTAGGCPGSRMIEFPVDMEQVEEISTDGKSISSPVMIGSELRQWPVQMHLVNPDAPYFRNADVILAADCVAFSVGNFHQEYLRGHGLAIACPKLDQGKEMYIEKLKNMIDKARIRSLSVMVMEVPCCSGLLHIAQLARQQATRTIPIKQTVISIRGEVLRENII